MPLTTSEILLKYWKFSSFREHQVPVVNAILEGKDTFALMTTGGGKSICFQVPAMMKEGICLVVSPLVALMKDQVAQLNARGIPAAAYYSTQSTETQDKIMDYALHGKLKFLYISPERLTTRSFLQQMRDMKIAYLVVDEAHCISQWGYDFRPSYLKISESYVYLKDIPRIALTASATPRVVKDIVDQLELRSPEIIQYSFYKPKLSYQVFLTDTKVEQMARWLRKLGGSGLIYVNRRSAAEVLVRELKTQFQIEADFYHAGLSIEERNNKQEKWIQTPNSFMISTNAFGMGIDNPHVNFVIHYHMPDSLEAYFQEAGRAGRAGQDCFALGLVSQADLQEKKDTISHYPKIDEVKALAILLFNYYEIPYEKGENLKFEFVIEDFISHYQLNLIHTSKCIQILKENELIFLQESYYKPDEIQIVASEDQIGELRESNPNYYMLLQNIIRIFEGVFYRRKISLHKLVKQYHYSLYDLKSMLRNLKKWGLIEYTESTNKPTITFLINKVPKDDIPIDHQQYLQRKKIQIDQIQSVIDYIENTTDCRSQKLLTYFGEIGHSSCGICDICIQTKTRVHVSKDDYLKIRDVILVALQKNVYTPIDKLIKKNKPLPEQSVRRVIDRLIELNQIEKGAGECYRLV